MSKPKALGWFGGKAGYGKAEWIASQLPWERDTTYVETHGGMFGVGLARQPVKCEIFNDLDERVVNWWRVVREHPDEFGRLVEGVPHSRREYQLAGERVDNPDLSPIQRALAFHTICLQSRFGAVGSGRTWKLGLSPAVGSFGRWRSERVAALAERMWNVQLECRNGLELLEKTADREYAVVYVDPPYRDAPRHGYRINHDHNDVDRLIELLQAQRGHVAVSGYADEWDRLGWRRTEKAANAQQHGPALKRVEVLWMNYPEVR